MVNNTKKHHELSVVAAANNQQFRNANEAGKIKQKICGSGTVENCVTRCSKIVFTLM